MGTPVVYTYTFGQMYLVLIASSKSFTFGSLILAQSVPPALVLLAFFTSLEVVV